MALQTQQLERTFRYNSVDLIDPGAQYTPEQVRDFYAPTYPEILNAAIEGPDEKDGKLQYTFRRAVGTKGVEIKMFPEKSWSFAVAGKQYTGFKVHSEWEHFQKLVDPNGQILIIYFIKDTAALDILSELGIFSVFGDAGSRATVVCASPDLAAELRREHVDADKRSRRSEDLIGARKLREEV